MPYRITSFLKHSEQSDYVDGCDHATSQTTVHDSSITGDTKQDVLDQIIKYFGVDHKDIKLDACEQVGRVDISLMQDRNCFRADEAALNIWRSGKLDLWQVTYSGYLERTEPESWVNGKKLKFKIKGET